jgi:ribosomal protein L37AE/L43A
MIRMEHYTSKEGHRYGGKACDEPYHKDTCGGQLKKYRKLVTLNNKPYGNQKHQGVWVCDKCNKMFIGHPKGCRWLPDKNEIVRDRIMRKWEHKALDNYRMLSGKLKVSKEYYEGQIEWREKALNTGLYEKYDALKLQTEIDYIKSTILPDFEYRKELLNTRSW